MKKRPPCCHSISIALQTHPKHAACSTFFSVPQAHCPNVGIQYSAPRTPHGSCCAVSKNRFLLLLFLKHSGVVVVGCSRCSVLRMRVLASFTLSQSLVEVLAQEGNIYLDLLNIDSQGCLTHGNRIPQSCRFCSWRFRVACRGATIFSLGLLLLMPKFLEF